LIRGIYLECEVHIIGFGGLIIHHYWCVVDSVVNILDEILEGNLEDLGGTEEASGNKPQQGKDDTRYELRHLYVFDVILFVRILVIFEIDPY
jgi:hypothetical protein